MKLSLVLGILTLILLPGNLQAQSFPSKPVHVVTPFPAGSSADVAARIIGKQLEKIFGQPVIVENKPGAFGEIGVRDVLKSQDGHTVCFCSDGQLTIIPAAHRVLGRSGPYDPQTDLVPIGMGMKLHFVLVAQKDAPFGTFAELATYARANPGKLSVASPHPTGALVAGTLKSVSGLSINIVPYQGEPRAMTDLMGGHVHLMAATSVGVLGQIGTGQLKLVGAIGAERNPFFPELRSLVEQGASEFAELPVSWGGFFAPRGVAPQTVAVFSEALDKALADKDTSAALRGGGAIPFAASPQELAGLIARDLGGYLRLMQKTGVKIIGD